MTLIEFFYARIDDEAAGKVWDEQGFNRRRTDQPIPPFDPKRILAECEAKRTVVATYQEAIKNAQDDRDAAPGMVAALELVLKCLALPYAEHPDYQPEWAVSPIRNNH